MYSRGSLVVRSSRRHDNVLQLQLLLLLHKTACSRRVTNPRQHIEPLHHRTFTLRTIKASAALATMLLCWLRLRIAIQVCRFARLCERNMFCFREKVTARARPARCRSSRTTVTTAVSNTFSHDCHGALNNTIRYGRLSCVQKLTGWLAQSSARPRNEKVRKNKIKT